MRTRKIVSLFLIAALCLNLAACGKSEPEPEPVNAVPTEAPTEPPEETRAPPEILPEMKEWLEINEDVVGYVRIGDTKVNYPVLQGPDNDYYMDNDINHKECKSEACITADYRSVYDGWDYPTNVLLYGHNSMKGTYFASLSNYYKTTVDGSLSHYKKYPLVEFNTLYEKMEYKVFACVLFNTQPDLGEVIPYWDYVDFKGEDDFHEFILTIMDRSILFTDVDIEYGDKIMTLHTCYYPYGKEVDSRVVVFARQVREGESNEVDTDKAKHNRQAIRFKEEEKRIGTMYPGERVWDTSYLISYKPPKKKSSDKKKSD